MARTKQTARKSSKEVSEARMKLIKKDRLSQVRESLPKIKDFIENYEEELVKFETQNNKYELLLARLPEYQQKITDLENQVADFKVKLNKLMEICAPAASD